jgi:hypothetical protein
MLRRTSRRRPRPEINYLDLIPSHAVESEPQGEPDRVVLRMPRFRDAIFGRLLQPRLRGDRRFIRVPLDRRGSWLWSEIDGQRTVGDLARRFRAAFPEDAGQVEERLCHYVAAMVGHGFMTVRGR